jgi:hypothetical protein
LNPLSNPNVLFLIVLAVVTLGYSWSCAVYPYRPCRSCRGIGAFRSPLLRAIRLCRRCSGTGRTLRAGRRAYNSCLRARRSYRDLRDRDRRDNSR